MNLKLRLSALVAAIVLGSALGFVLSAATAAPASSPFAARSLWVSYSDLDLTRRDHLALLERRIETAARRLCRSPDARSLKEIRHAEACVTQAVSRALVEATQAAADAEARRFDDRAGSQR